MRNKVVAILLSIAFMILLLPAPSARADGFDVGTLRERYAILVDANDPTTALMGIEKNADTQCATGSTIKILTCMLAIESGRLDEEASVSDNAVNFNKKYNSLMGLEAGEKFEALIAEYDTSTETLGKTIDMPIMVNTTSVYWNDGVINAAFDAQMTEPGCYSQPYADKAGVHIAYYVSDVPSGFAEYTDEIGAAIKQYLVSVKREETIFGWADEYEIVINNDEIDAMIAQIEAEALAAEEAEIAAIQAYAEQVEKERAEAAKNKD